MNKMGFTVKMNWEKIFYIIFIALLVLFIFNLNNIYQLGSRIRAKGIKSLFTTEKVEEENPKDDSEQKEESDDYEVVTPVGKSYIKCSKESEVLNGDVKSIIKLYYTDDKLKSIEEIKSFSGINDEFINYMYSESGKYKTRKETNKELKGYSVVVNQKSTTSLEISSVIDLSKASISDIKLETSETLDMTGTLNMSASVVASDLEDNKYTCER